MRGTLHAVMAFVLICGWLMPAQPAAAVIEPVAPALDSSRLARVVNTMTEQAYLKALTTIKDDRFGYSVAIDGDTMVVAANAESGSYTSTMASPNNVEPSAGAAYVFTRSVDGTWTQVAYLKASNAGRADSFGYSLAFSGDTIVVGAYQEDGSITSTLALSNEAASNSGAAYVFTRSVDGTWVQAAYLKASNADANDFFGRSVALSGDTVVVGADGEDGSYTSTKASPDNAVSGAGAAYVFTRSVDGTWEQAAYLKVANAGVNDYFGQSVALSGDTIVVGAIREDGSITSTLASPNDVVTSTGAAYVFTRSVDGTWEQAAYLKASNAEEGDYFGNSVAVDGDTIVVTAVSEDGSHTSTLALSNNDAEDAGAAYVFTRSVAGTWTQAAYLKASNAGKGDYFGGVVALDGDTVVVSASKEDGSITSTSTLALSNNDAEDAGAAYVFTRRVAGTWEQAAYLKASNAEANDMFGGSAAVFGDTVVIGTSYEPGSVTSTVGSPNNLAQYAGAVYVFIFASTDASLLSLETAPGTLAPAFVSSTMSYTASVPNGTTSALVTATTSDVSATVAYASSAGACAGTNCAVAAPKTWITATVTAADGQTAQEYFIEITVADGNESDDASLLDLAIAPGALAPVFVSTTTSYTAHVPNGTTQVQVTATTSDVSATVAYATSAGGCQGAYCSVAAPKTWITATVTAADGTTTQEYYIEIMVADLGASSDANLIDLAIAPGALAPAFVSSTTSYTAHVPNGTAQVQVTATVSDANATVAYASSAGGCQGAYCSVAAPKTWITVTVTAADGTTTQEYYIEITATDANASNDASLGDLAIAPGTLAPAFVSSTNAYEAGVPNGTTSAAVTATPSDANATVTYESSAGACALPGARGTVAPANCAVAGPKTWITVTVTAADGATTEQYFIEITVAAPLTMIDRVWPGTGLPAGGMPVQIFGSGFVAVLTVTVGPYTDGLMIDVLFDLVNDKQIDFVMPAGVAGQRVSVTVATAGEAQTVPDAFTYVEPTVIEFNGLTGGVFTTTDGVVVEIPSQGVDGMFVITLTPLPPASGVPGNILMYSFRLDALLNGFKLETLTNSVKIKLPIDENIFALADGERPWLYSWTADGRRLTAAETTAVGGRWVLVRGQEYDASTYVMMVALRPMGVYALSTAYLRAFWFPVVPVVK